MAPFFHAHSNRNLQAPFTTLPAVRPTFRGSWLRYLAHFAVRGAQRQGLHAADELLELTVVADPLLAALRLGLREPLRDGLASDLVGPLVVGSVEGGRIRQAAAALAPAGHESPDEASWTDEPQPGDLCLQCLVRGRDVLGVHGFC